MDVSIRQIVRLKRHIRVEPCSTLSTSSRRISYLGPPSGHHHRTRQKTISPPPVTAPLGHAADMLKLSGVSRAVKRVYFNHNRMSYPALIVELLCNPAQWTAETDYEFSGAVRLLRDAYEKCIPGEEGEVGASEYVFTRSLSCAGFSTDRLSTLGTYPLLFSIHSLTKTLRMFSESENCPSESVVLVTQLLVRRYEMELQNGGPTKTLTEQLRPIWRSCTAYHVGSIAKGLSTLSDEEDGGLRFEWRSVVQLDCVELYLRRALHEITNDSDDHDGSGYRDHILHGSQCRLPSDGRTSRGDNELDNIARLCLMCNKKSTSEVICQLYHYYASLGNVSIANLVRVVSNCSLHANSIQQTGLSSDPMVMETLLSVVDALVAHAATDLPTVEEGLYNGCILLQTFGLPDRVISIYDLFPIRETPYSVMARISVKDVKGALKALDRIAAQRPGGWKRLPAIVRSVMVPLCRLVGSVGKNEDIEDLYKVLIGFQNSVMLVGGLMESLFAGICDRIEAIGKEIKFMKNVNAKKVVNHVIPFFRTALLFVGDDFNTDAILQVLEVSLQARPASVVLTSAVMWTLQRASSNSIQELFLRVDKSTHNIPFLYYFALCYCRDMGERSTMERLAEVWQVDGRAIWAREPHLAPAYKMWRCTSCGRVNSDRFNYCVCSALRSGQVLCNTCGYAQCEQVPFCRSCGSAVSSTTTQAAVIRKPWHCHSCKSNNPARHVLRCCTCGQPTGPVLRKTNEHHTSSFCACAPSDSPAVVSYKNAVGYCSDCHQPKMEYARQHSSVWRCTGCRQLRSSLERVCPNCPQVECLPFAVQHAISATRYCWSCHAAEGDPFTDTCSACGVQGDLHLTEHSTAATADTKVAQPQEEQQPMAQREVVFFSCDQCGNLQKESDTVDHKCEQCGAILESNEETRLTLRDRQCIKCGSVTAAEHMGCFCRSCLSYLPPTVKQGWTSAVVISTCEELAACFDSEGHDGKTEQAVTVQSFSEKRYEQLTSLLGELATQWKTQVEHTVLRDARIQVLMALRRLTTSLEEPMSYNKSARRACGLVKQLMIRSDEAPLLDKDTTLQNNFYAPKEKCTECLGGHPTEICEFNTDAEWICEDCGTANTNEDICRYLCCRCLALRPVVQDLLPSECWECGKCGRANIEFETYCIHCGIDKEISKKANEEAAKRREVKGVVRAENEQTLL
ncbi:hypothetical protein AGDE_11625, partial [Angomonas deanei]